MNDITRKPPREPTSIDDGKLRLYGNPLIADGRPTMLRVKMDNNNPCIEVDTGTKTEGKNGRDGYPIKIETPMSPRPFRVLMDLIEKVASFKGGNIAFEIDNWGHPFIWDRDQGKNVRSKDRMVVSRFSIAKREDGMVTFGVTAPKKPDVTFEFQADDFHPITQNGQTVPVSISSSLSACAWAGHWKDMFVAHFERNWKEPEFMKKRRLENMQRATGGGGGNYQNNTNSNGGGQQQQRPQSQAPQPATAAAPGSGDFDSFDDDVGF